MSSRMDKGSTVWGGFASMALGTRLYSLLRNSLGGFERGSGCKEWIPTVLFKRRTLAQSSVSHNKAAF